MSLDRLLEHCEQPYHRGPAPCATHAHEQTNPACGDTVRIELTIEDNIIHHAYFTGVGCRISQAAASMLVEHIEGRPLSDINLFSARDMLTLFGPPLTPLRQRCCLLAWQALQQAIYSPLAVSSSHP